MRKIKEWSSMKTNMKKVMAAIAASCMCMGLFAGCGDSADTAETSAAGESSQDTSAASDNTSAESTASEGGVLRVGMECAYAPFNWTQSEASCPDGGTAEPIYGQNTYAYGYDVMVAQKIAAELGMSLEIHKVEWDSIGLSMDSGEYDCIIAGMGRTAEREKSYSFTEPYYYRDNCIVVKTDSELADITGLSQLAGKNVTVTTQLGTGWVPLLDQIPDATLGANYETTAEVFMAVSNGVADLAVIDAPTAESALLTNKDLKLIRLDESDTFTGDQEMTNVCIATRKDDTELRDKIQGAMDSIGWNDKAAMDELMEKAIASQPAAN